MTLLGAFATTGPQRPRTNPTLGPQRPEIDSPALPPPTCTADSLVELTLKQPERLDALLRAPDHQSEVITRFLAVALVGFTVFGVALTLALNIADRWPAWVPAARWAHHSAANLVLAYDLGVIGAIGVCLPSFYFYGLLAGVKISMLQVTAHAMKGLGRTSVTLVGILPIYVAIVLGLVVLRAPTAWLDAALYLGLALPLIAGLSGVRSLYIGFVRLADTFPPERRCRRECFLRRLVLAWSACYTVVTPVAIYSLWNYLSL